jgi:hypothetical protein
LEAGRNDGIQSFFDEIAEKIGLVIKTKFGKS